MRNIQELLDEVKYGKLTEEEIIYVAQKIKENIPEHDPDFCWYIYILGRAGADQYRNLVEKFLHYPFDEWICKNTLVTLCRYWNLTREYLDDVKMYIRGAKWDYTDDVRFEALSIAGDI